MLGCAVGEKFLRESMCGSMRFFGEQYRSIKYISIQFQLDSFLIWLSFREDWILLVFW